MDVVEVLSCTWSLRNKLIKPKNPVARPEHFLDSLHLPFFCYKMPTVRFEPSSIKNKVKREEIARKAKRAKRQAKLQKRLERAKIEEKDPLAKKVCMTDIISFTMFIVL